MTDTAANEPAGGGLFSDRSGGLVPAWLENLAALGWRVLVIAALVVVIWYMATLIWNVVASIILAIIVAVILAPLVLRLRAGGRSRSSAALVTWLVAIGAVLGLVLLFVLALLPYLGDVVDWISAGQAEFEARLAELDLPGWLNTLVEDIVASSKGLSGDAVSNVVGSVANLVGILILATFLLYFFLRDGDKAWMWLFQAVSDDKRGRITAAGDDVLSHLGKYVRGTTAIAAIASVSSGVFMLILGVPLALPLAIITFITAYIPYFGVAAASLIIVLVTLGAAGSTAALVMVVLIVARWAIVRTWVQPRVFAEATRLHPVVILIVLPIGFYVGGLAGLVLAVPITAVLVSVARSAIDILVPDTPTNLPEMVPAWLDIIAQWSWRALIAIIFVAGLGFILTTIPLVVLPVIIGLILAATIGPIANALVHRGQSRGRASAIAVGGSTFALIAVLALTIASLAEQAEEIADTSVSGAESVNEAAGGQLSAGVDALQSGVDAGVGTILELTGDLAAVAIVLILTVLLTFYFLRDGGRLWKALMSHLPTDVGSELSDAGGRAFGVLGGYMFGTGAISLVGAASQLVIMWILGLPLALPIFVLSFFGGFIPYIGSLLTTMLAFLVAVAVGDTMDIVIMGIWTVAFNLVQGNIVAPMVYNRTTSIHPAIVLAAIPAGSAVAGILGMFLVVPVLGVVSTSWRSVLKIMGGGDYEPTVPPQDDIAGIRDEVAAPDVT